jgi:hypothetical protein
MISHQKQQINFGEYKPILQSEDILKNAQVRQDLADQNLAAVKDAVDTYGRLRSYLINDNARNYFDQELKKLTGAIKENAGLDFSNKANLASVLNIGKTFENDKYIVNGLKWGKEKERRAKELLSVDEEFRNSDNDLVFMNDIYEYEKEGGLDSKVNSNVTYTPYTDVTEVILEMEKDIQGQMLIQQQNMPGGYINFKEIEVKTAEEVRNRIKNLPPEMQQQINIHAQANMIRMGKENTYKVVKEHQLAEYNQAEQLANNARIALGNLRATGKKDSETRALIFEAEQILKQSETTARVLKEEIQKPADQYNPNDYVKIFEENFLSQIAQKAAYQKTKNNIKENQIGLENLRSQNRMKEINAQTLAEMQRREMELIQKDTQIGTTVTHQINVRTLASNPEFVPFLAGKLTVENIEKLKNAIHQKAGNLRARGINNLSEREKRTLDYYNSLTEPLGQISAVLSSAKEDDYIDFGSENTIRQGASPFTAISTKRGAQNYTVEQALETGFFGLRTKLPKKSSEDKSSATQTPGQDYFEKLEELQEKANLAETKLREAQERYGLDETNYTDPKIARIVQKYQEAQAEYDNWVKQ